MTKVYLWDIKSQRHLLLEEYGALPPGWWEYLRHRKTRLPTLSTAPHENAWKKYRD